MLILSILAIGSVSLVLAQGTVAILDFIFLGARLLGNLPEVFWWTAGAAVLVICGLGTLRNLVVRMYSRSRKPTLPSSQPGRLGDIHRHLSRVNTGEYARNEVRELLQVLAVDFIALKLDSSDLEAAELFREGGWTEDSALRSYFLSRKSFSEQGRRLRRFLNKPDPAPFLKETRNTLDRLICCGEFQEKKEFGNTQSDD